MAAEDPGKSTGVVLLLATDAAGPAVGGAVLRRDHAALEAYEALGRGAEGGPRRVQAEAAREHRHVRQRAEDCAQPVVHFGEYF